MRKIKKEKVSGHKPLITPVMDVSFPDSVGKDSFDMLKTIGFGGLVGLLQV